MRMCVSDGGMRKCVPDGGMCVCVYLTGECPDLVAALQFPHGDLGVVFPSRDPQSESKNKSIAVRGIQCGKGVVSYHCFSHM
jgi:hypothetical protein